jgi:hypothetical protein
LGTVRRRAPKTSLENVKIFMTESPGSYRSNESVIFYAMQGVCNFMQRVWTTLTPRIGSKTTRRVGPGTSQIFSTISAHSTTALVHRVRYAMALQARTPGALQDHQKIRESLPPQQRRNASQNCFEKGYMFKGWRWRYSTWNFRQQDGVCSEYRV